MDPDPRRVRDEAADDDAERGDRDGAAGDPDDPSGAADQREP